MRWSGRVKDMGHARVIIMASPSRHKLQTATGKESRIGYPFHVAKRLARANKALNFPQIIVGPAEYPTR